MRQTNVFNYLLILGTEGFFSGYVRIW